MDNSLVGWRVAQDNVESIDAVNRFRVHVDVDILEKVLEALRIQLGHALEDGLNRFSLPGALR